VVVLGDTGDLGSCRVVDALVEREALEVGRVSDVSVLRRFNGRRTGSMCEIEITGMSRHLPRITHESSL
jgi:hypothetical protein